MRYACYRLAASVRADSQAAAIQMTISYRILWYRCMVSYCHLSGIGRRDSLRPSLPGVTRKSFRPSPLLSPFYSLPTSVLFTCFFLSLSLSPSPCSLLVLSFGIPLISHSYYTCTLSYLRLRTGLALSGRLLPLQPLEGTGESKEQKEEKQEKEEITHNGVSTGDNRTALLGETASFTVRRFPPRRI